MKIIILSDYFIENEINRASFRIRYLTALKMFEKGHNVSFIYPSGSCKLVNNSNKNHGKENSIRIIGTPGILPMKFRTGGFGFIDCIFKILFVLTHPVDVIQVGSGHRPSNFVPSMVCKYLKRSIIIDECWEWLGEGGYADFRKGLFGRIISLYDKYFEIKFRSFFDKIIVISTELKKRFKNNKNVTVLFGGIENQALRSYGLDEAREMVGIPNDVFLVGMSNVIRGDHEENKTFFKAYNKCLSSCNVFVLPYPNTVINRCRWPNKIGDFICLERPIITNSTGDVKEIFEKYKLGSLCDENWEAFYDSIEMIMNMENEDNFDADEARFVSNNLLTFNGRIDRMLAIFYKTIEKKK